MPTSPAIATERAVGAAAPPAAVAPAGPRTPRVRRVWGGDRGAAWLALACYLAARAAGFGVLAAWGRDRGVGVLRLLSERSDAAWYLGIARNGYDGGSGQSDLAFFPLYPALTRAVAEVIGWGAYPGLVVAWTAGAAAALGLFALGTTLYGRRAGVVLAVLWGVLPHAVVELMAYSEPLFTALAAWSLVALLRRRWLTAGVLCLLAGLARPSAVALVPVLVLDAAVTLVRLRGHRWRDGWRPLLAAVLAPLGTAGYLGWVAARTGRLDGWSRIQRDGWRSSWDWGRDTVLQLGDVLAKEEPLELYVVSGTVVAAVLLLVLAALDRPPWQVLAVGALSLAVAVGSAGYYYSKARFLLTAFPLLLPLALPLARCRAAKAAVVLAGLAAASAWFGGYLLLTWRWSP